MKGVARIDLGETRVGWTSLKITDIDLSLRRGLMSSGFVVEMRGMGIGKATAEVVYQSFG